MVVDVNFVVIDNNHLTRHGVEYLCSRYYRVFVVTTNYQHPSRSVVCDNLEILTYDNLSLASVLCDLHNLYGCEKLTIQTGGTLNGLLLREKLIDYVDIVIAPIFVGGKDTPTLIDGGSATMLEELGVLKLLKVVPLQGSYLRLRYKVIS